MSTAQARSRPELVKTEYIDFWNAIMVPKFIRWKPVIVDGLTL